jgi:hypothetical protein
MSLLRNVGANILINNKIIVREQQEESIQIKRQKLIDDLKELDRQV